MLQKRGSKKQNRRSDYIQCNVAVEEEMEKITLVSQRTLLKCSYNKNEIYAVRQRRIK